MRFRKSIKLLPGLKINVSGSGISTTVGAKGASVNLKSGRSARITTGLPGTGLSHTEKIGATPDEQTAIYAAPMPRPLWIYALCATWGALKIIVLLLISIAAGILIALTLGGSNKKR